MSLTAYGTLAVPIVAFLPSNRIAMQRLYSPSAPDGSKIEHSITYVGYAVGCRQCHGTAHPHRTENGSTSHGREDVLLGGFEKIRNACARRDQRNPRTSATIYSHCYYAHSGAEAEYWLKYRAQQPPVAVAYEVACTRAHTPAPPAHAPASAVRRSSAIIIVTQ